MNDTERAAREWEHALECLVAEVAAAAYDVALRHGAEGSWLDLELRLWEALARTVREWGHLPPGPCAEEFPSGVGGNDRSQVSTALLQRT
jgi:hypothetical protein